MPVYDILWENSTKLQLKCPTDGHIWTTTRIKPKTCPYCRKIRRVKKIVKRENGTMMRVIDPKVTNSKLMKMEFKCEDPDHTSWEATYNNIIYYESWCPMCTILITEKMVEYSLYILLGDKYTFACRKPNWLRDLENYHIDLYNEELRLCVEIDGDSHHNIENYNRKKMAKLNNWTLEEVDKYCKERDDNKTKACAENGYDLIRFKYDSHTYQIRTMAIMKPLIYDCLAQYLPKRILKLLKNTKDEYMAIQFSKNDVYKYYKKRRYNEVKTAVESKGASIATFKLAHRRDRVIDVVCSKCKKGTKTWSFDDCVRTDDSARALCCESCKPVQLSKLDISTTVGALGHEYIMHDVYKDNSDRSRVQVTFKCCICNDTHGAMYDNLKRALRDNNSNKGCQSRQGINHEVIDSNGSPVYVKKANIDDDHIEILEKYSSNKISKFRCMKHNTVFHNSMDAVIKSKETELFCVVCSIEERIYQTHDCNGPILTNLTDYTAPVIGSDAKPGNQFKQNDMYKFNCDACKEDMECGFTMWPGEARRKTMHKCLGHASYVWNERKKKSKCKT